MTDTAPNSARTAALQIVARLCDAGFAAYFAGGCVRDMLMGREPVDYDVATNATPERVSNLFPKTVQVGAAFGVVQVVTPEHTVEVATFRRDVDSEDGRHPVSIEFCDELEDAKRRDFTINGMFYNPATDRVIDYVEGRRDIERRIIRAIGDPAQRFAEDFLRMLRAVRFASVLEFEMGAATADAIRAQAPQIAKVSAERIRQEVTRLLTESNRAGDGIVMLRDLGLLRIILPEVDALAGQEQPPAFHPEGDVFTHTVSMLNRLERPSPTLAYATLLHDIGKPPTADTSIEEDGSERIRFNSHASVGADMAESVMRRLRFSNQLVEDVVFCVRNHMRFLDVPNMKRSTLRKMIAAPTFFTELELHRLDCVCSHGDLGNYDYLNQLLQETEIQQPALPPPWITGTDIIELGVPEGPEIGHWHRKAYDAQLEGRFKGRKELLRWLRDSLAEIDTEN